MAEATGFRGRIETDPAKPDGTPRKLMNVDRLTAMGWQASISIAEAIEATYRRYPDHAADARV